MTKFVPSARGEDQQALYITCPTKETVVPTGFVFSRKSAETAKVGSASVYCPACGGRHSWSLSGGVVTVES